MTGCSRSTSPQLSGQCRVSSPILWIQAIITNSLEWFVFVLVKELSFERQGVFGDERLAPFPYLFLSLCRNFFSSAAGQILTLTSRCTFGIWLYPKSGLHQEGNSSEGIQVLFSWSEASLWQLCHWILQAYLFDLIHIPRKPGLLTE